MNFRTDPEQSMLAKYHTVSVSGVYHSVLLLWSPAFSVDSLQSIRLVENTFLDSFHNIT